MLSPVTNPSRVNLNHKPLSQLTEDQQWDIVDAYLLHPGSSITLVAEYFNVSPTTVGHAARRWGARILNKRSTTTQVSREEARDLLFHKRPPTHTLFFRGMPKPLPAPLIKGEC